MIEKNHSSSFLNDSEKIKSIQKFDIVRILECLLLTGVSKNPVNGGHRFVLTVTTTNSLRSLRG